MLLLVGLLAAFLALLSASTSGVAHAGPALPGQASTNDINSAPTAVTFPIMSWCFAATDVGSTPGQLSQGDTFRVTATLNNTGVTQDFRVGARLVTTGTPPDPPQRDLTFGGPTHLWGAQNVAPFSTNEATGTNITDLNRFGVASPNTDVKEAYGEVQNVLQVPGGGSKSFSVVFGLGRVASGTGLRVELYAYDIFSVLQGEASPAIGAYSIPYDGSLGGCIAPAGVPNQDVGSVGFAVNNTGGAQTSTSEGWINVDRPAYINSYTNIIIEVGVTTTQNTIEYVEDGSAIIDILDLTLNDGVKRTINFSTADPRNICNSTISIAPLPGSVSVVCRKQGYYTNIDPSPPPTGPSGQSPSGTGYNYTFNGNGSGNNVTYIFTLPIASNSNPPVVGGWLIPGHIYEVQMRAGAGTSSHATAAINSDQFRYLADPTALEFNTVNAEFVAADRDVLVSWETGTELQTEGYNVWRKRRGGEWKQLNSDLIAPKNVGKPVGASYTYTDSRVKRGKVYTYKVEILRADDSKDDSDKVRVKIPK